MKSFLLILPYLGLTAAHNHHRARRDVCSQDAVTRTVTNTFTVTIAPSSAESVEPTGESSPSPSIAFTTVYIVPSPVPHFPNASFHFSNTSLHSSTPSTVLFVMPSSSAVENEPTMTATAANDVARVPTSARPVIESPSPESPIESSSSAPTVPQSLSTASNPAADSTSTITATNKGEATFYGGNVSGGMCSFSTYSIPSGLFGTALSDFNWNSAGNCGACVSVTGPNGNSVKERQIVDQCPNCGPNHLDLFPDAFAKLADPSKGVIPVEWAIVPCGITSPLILHNKSGTSKYWFSMQVVNANIPVSKLEISTDGGKTWQATTRKEYNFFENPSGFGTETVDVRVTSTSGQAIVVKKVGVASGSSVTAGSNFS